MSAVEPNPESLTVTEKKVLIIEADKALSDEWADGLRDYGFKVATTADAEDGVSKAEKSRPDVILLRVELPNVNGYKLAKRLKDHDQLRDVPVILLSSEASPKDFDSHKKTKSRAQAYRSVPVPFDDVLEDVENLVGLPGPTMAEFQAEAVPAAKFNELEGKRSELLLEVDRLKEELESKIQSEVRLEHRLKELEKQTVENAGAAAEALQSELDSLRKELAEIKEERDDSRAELDSKKRILNKLKENLSKHESRIGELEALVESRPEVDLAPKVAELEEALEDVQGELESKKKVISKLKENIEKLEANTAPSEALDAERKMKEEALGELDDVRGELESKKKVVTTLKGKIEQLEKDLALAVEEKEELGSKRKAIPKLKERVEELEKDLASEKSAHEGDVSRLRETIADLTITADDAKRSAAKALRDREEAIEERGTLEKQHQKELDGLKQFYEPKVSALKQTEKELDKAKEEIRQRDRRIDEEARKNREMEDEYLDKFANFKREQQKALIDQERVQEELRKAIAKLDEDKSKMEQRVVKAYRKLRADESQLEKVRKALEIAMGLAKIDPPSEKKKASTDAGS